MVHVPRKPMKWVGSSKRDLVAMPDAAQDTFGHALDVAQAGQKHQQAKPLKGFGSAGVLEVIESDVGGTYRAVYTVRLKGWIYVLHCFQKKSAKGIETPLADIDLIKSRLAIAVEDHAKWLLQEKKEF